MGSSIYKFGSKIRMKKLYLASKNKGKIEEMGESDQIYSSPKSLYTQALIDAISKGI